MKFFTIVKTPLCFAHIRSYAHKYVIWRLFTYVATRKKAKHIFPIVYMMCARFHNRIDDDDYDSLAYVQEMLAHQR